MCDIAQINIYAILEHKNMITKGTSMIKKIFFIVCCLLGTSLDAAQLIARPIKRFVERAFGINANEPLITTPFIPSIENLNAVSLHRQSLTQGSEKRYMSVTELANMVYDNTIDDDGALLAIKGTDQVVKESWLVKKGIQLAPNEPVFIYSRGYAGAPQPEHPKSVKRQPRGLCAIPKRGGGIVTGYQWLKNGIINGQCIFFDYPDTRSYFDFGLENDRKCLDAIYKEVENKTHDIIFFGNCRGSKALLHYLTISQPEHVKAVILDAPFMDLIQFTQEIGKNYGKRIPFSKDIAYKIICYWHPSYRLEDDLRLDDLKHIPKDIPIFIGHLYHDALVSDQLMKDMVHALHSSGHNVYLLVLDDRTKSHSRLYQIKQFQQAVNAFLKEYNLPHNPELAEEGRFLLQYAQHSARHPEHWYIHRVA